MKIYRTTFATILLALLATACDTSCGYYTPREYFRDNPEAMSDDDCRTGRIFRHSVIHTRPAPVEPSYIPDKIVRASLSHYDRNPLYRYLCGVFGTEETLRLQQNLTQKELGEKIGVQKAQISRMERGYSISIPTMSRVFKALGIATTATLDLGVAGKIALW